MGIGFIAGILYYIKIIGITQDEICECIISISDGLFVVSEGYGSILGIHLIYWALIGFGIGFILSILAALNSTKSMIILTFGAIVSSFSIVPYTIFIELNIVGAVCLYCTIMQGAIVATALYSIYLLWIRSP